MNNEYEIKFWKDYLHSDTLQRLKLVENLPIRKMISNPPSHLQSIIESICELGCDRVNEIIDALEHGSSVEETRGLDKSDQHQVLAELKAIMAVYDKEQA